MTDPLDLLRASRAQVHELEEQVASLTAERDNYHAGAAYYENEWSDAERRAVDLEARVASLTAALRGLLKYATYANTPPNILDAALGVLPQEDTE